MNVLPPQDDGYLIEMLAFSDGKARRDYLLFGEVVTKAPTGVSSGLTLVTQDGKRTVYFERALELGDTSRALVSNNQGNIKPGRYALIISDSNDFRCLWVSSEPTDKLLYNGETLTKRHWVRRLLRDGDQIECGDVKLKVNGGSRAAINLPFQLDFSALRVQNPLQQTFKVDLRLTAAGWEGKVISLVPWLKVKTPAVQLSLLARSTEVTIQTTDAAYALENATYFETAALALYNEESVYFLSARLEVDVANYAIDIQPKQIEFMSSGGQPLHAGEVAGQTESCEITHLGRKPVTLTLTPTVPWLEVTPRAITLAPMQKQSVRVTLTAFANQLNSGVQLHSNAI